MVKNVMPELPEVAVSIAYLLPRVKYARIETIDEHIHQSFSCSALPSEEMRAAQIQDIFRHGKYIIFDLGNELFLTVHLRMSGQLRLFVAKEALDSHERISVYLDNGLRMAFIDTRKFGRMYVARGREQLLSSTGMDRVGPDPLLDEVDVQVLYANAARSSIAIKQYLLSQKPMVGLGNIYVDEVLFRCGISPLRSARDVSDVQWDGILSHSREVLAEAIEKGGTTIHSFIASSGQSGGFQKELKVYGRGGQDCVSCDSVLEKLKVNGRTTVYCKKCQV